ncbi:MAG: hypothetical protein HZB25_06405 [Candidatus Eisenbacteria bacterium]|nr:hypothetical protein [Candidatus Eisenbacteria bacterium]
MKRTILTLSCAALCMLLPLAVYAAEGTAPASAPPASPAFESLKALEGTWAGKASHGSETFDMEVTYKVTAAGSTVMETIFGGTPHEMVTMYTRAGHRVALTHYCAHGNQPHMLLSQKSTAKQLVFDYEPSPGINPKRDAHMHSAKIDLVDADHLRSEWASYEGGKQHGVAVFELARKK